MHPEKAPRRQPSGGPIAEGAPVHWEALDGLRAVAILPVVLFHAGVPAMRGGFVGVDVFFVISGFLITKLLLGEIRLKGTIDVVAFYERRARRILPGLLLMMLVVAVLGACFLTPIMEQQDLGKSMVSTSLASSNVYFWLSTGGYFDSHTESSTLLNTWSLGVEEQFYLIWPFLLIAVQRIAVSRRWRPTSLLLPSTIAILVASFAACVWATDAWGSAAFFLTPFRAWELMLGCVLAFCAWSSPAGPRAQAAALGWIGMAAIGWSVATLDAFSRFPGFAAAIPTLGTAAIIHAVVHSPASAVITRLLSLSPLVAIGQLSYSWYLWHWPLLVIARSARPDTDDPMVDLAIVIGALVPAWLSFHFVERPLRAWRRSEAPGRSRALVFSASLVGCTLVILSGLALGAHAKYFGQRAERTRIAALGAADKPSSYQTCLQLVPFLGLSDQTACLIGEGTSPDILLWGDSHANQFAPMLAEHARRTGISALERSMAACPPILAYESTFLGNYSRDCTAFNAATLSEIKSLTRGRLKGVVMAARWTMYFGARPLDRTFLRQHERMLRLQSVAELQSNSRDHLARTIRELRGMGLRVLLIGPSPEFGKNVPLCVLRSDRPEDCARPLEKVNEYRTSALDTLHTLAMRTPGVRLWDPVQFLCTGDSCEGVRAGRILYFDSNHVAASAARDLATPAAADLDWLLAER